MTVAVPLPYDLHDALIPLADAAQLASVTVPVVRNWIKRGYRGRDGKWTHLPAHWDAGGRWLVRPIDVLKVEAATRTRARRDITG